MTLALSVLVAEHVARRVTPLARYSLEGHGLTCTGVSYYSQTEVTVTHQATGARSRGTSRL